MSDLTRHSKFLSLVLRHQPEAAGITLDANGWADIEELVTGARSAGVELSRGRISLIMANDPKRRLVIDESGTRIRAAQGHSVAVDLAYSPATPPTRLFHGTHPRALEAILREGLRPMQRSHVHLSADVETARAVGARRRRPEVLVVDAAGLHAAGAPFWQASNGVWLCDAVAPKWLTRAGQDA